MKITQTQKGSDVAQSSIGINDDRRKGKIILGQNVFESLLLRQDSALFELMKLSEQHEDRDVEIEEQRNIKIKQQKELIAKLEKLRRFLLALKTHKPEMFDLFVEEFMETKFLYGKTAEDVGGKRGSE